MEYRRLLTGLLGVGLLILLCALPSCSPTVDRQLQTAVAAQAATAAVALQTQVVVAGQTVIAGGVKSVETQAALLQKTAEAAVKTETARLQTEVAKIVVPSSVPTRQGGLDYFALGDSIASGHGLNADLDDCHRSTQAYPYKLKAQLEQRFPKVTLFHYACSGATAEYPGLLEVWFKDYFKWFRNQVDETLKHLSTDRPTLITITIGANDLEWADWTTYLQKMCLPSTIYWDWIEGVKKKVSEELYTQIQRLVKGRPNVSVLLTEVHNPVNKNNSIFLRMPLCGDVLGVLDDYERTHYAVSALSQAYFDVWYKFNQPAWMRVVPIHAIFDAHASPRPKCGDGDPDIQNTWIQYPGDPNSNSDSLVKLLTGEKYGDCFHPNAKGAQAIADQLNEYAKKVGK